MPIYHDVDGIGPYFQYGKSGKRYHYQFHNKKSLDHAYKRALLQSQAIHASKSRKK